MRMEVFLLVLFAILIFCVACDISEEDFIHPWLESLFYHDDEELALLGAVLPITWTFAATILMFFLGCMRERQYEIRIIVSLCLKFSYSELLWFFMAFILDLAFIVVAFMFNWPITLTVLSIIQLAFIAYALLMVCVETSQTTVWERIICNARDEMENTGEISTLLMKVLCNFNYRDVPEVKILYKGLLKITELTDNVREKKARDYVEQIAEVMIKIEEDTQRLFEIFAEWMALPIEPEQQKDELKGELYIKEGIIQSLLKVTDACVYSIFIKILEIQFEDKRNIILWAIVYCWKNSDCVNQQFLRARAIKIAEMLELRVKDRELLMKKWIAMFNEEKEEHEENEELKDYRLDDFQDMLDELGAPV